MSLRVLIVDDSAFMRRALKRMIESEPGFEIAGMASDGAEGVRLAHELQPDIVTLDVKMPVMDGLQALSKILAHRPVPVLMLSSLTGEGAETTIRALELGAVDFIDKSSVSSSMDIVSIAPTLLGKLRAIGQVSQEKISLTRNLLETREFLVPPAPKTAGGEVAPYDVIAIGSSTGGPSCLQALLLPLPKNYPHPIAIVQHMPIGFTRSLAERLNTICSVEVREAAEGDELRPGRAVIAPAGQHLLVRKTDGKLVCHLSDEPKHALHRPSVDVLFASVVKTVGKRAVGILLTGMGKDGAKGLLAMRQAGCETIAQDEKTSVVWGMPRAAVELGAAGSVLPLPEIRALLQGLSRTAATK